MLTGRTEANTHSNLLFVMADIIDTLMRDVQQLLRKDGFTLRQECRRDFNAAIYNLRKLRRHIDHCQESTQECFGNDSDHLYEFIKLLIDRCGEDDEIMFKFYNYIKQFPSKHNMKNLDPTVFNDINKHKKHGTG